jgi:hypothetical protein
MRPLRWLLLMTVLCGIAAHAQTKGKAMQATGTFEVKVAPAEPTEFEKTNALVRYTLEKVWHGGFEGTSRGEMLSGDAPTGAMAYVALERMNGTLAGKTGTFVFTHQASMMKGNAKSGVMQIAIVPNSGTGELAGIAGSLTINIDATDKHSWVLEYTLP